MAAESAPVDDRTTALRWRPSQTAAWVEESSGDVVVMDLCTDEPLRLSPSAAAVWDALLDGLSPGDDLAAATPRTEPQVAATVAAVFGLSSEDVADDVHAFLRELEALGVVEQAG